MADETNDAPGPDWILPPPPSGGLTIHIAVDAEARLTPELQQAIEALLRAIPEEESVQGYARSCPCKGSHGVGSCPTQNCNPLSIGSCAVLYDCVVGLTGPRR